MRQISDVDLRFILKFELSQAPQSIRKGLSSGDQQIKDHSARSLVDRMVKRMADWEILVPEPGVNIFADDPRNPDVRFRFPVKR